MPHDETPTAPASLPRVEVFALGGTIASLPTGDSAGVSPAVRLDDLVAAVPRLAEVARVQATQVLQVPSCEITVPDLVGLVARMRAAVLAGAAGVVVTQGTDTLEESAFVLDLLWDRPEPVVVTGALRTPDAPGADGPANLLAAVRVAASPDAREAGVLAVLGDQVHAARSVRKAHTSQPSAFVSVGSGPLGAVSEGTVRFLTKPVERRLLSLPHSDTTGSDTTGSDTTSSDTTSGDTAGRGTRPRVAVVPVGLGSDDGLLRAVGEQGYDGLVVEAMGGGHVPRALVPVLAELASRIPVLLASRTGAGRVLSSSYGYPGGDVDLVARGLVPTGDLDATKARLLLHLVLTSGADRDRALAEVRRVVGE